MNIALIGYRGSGKTSVGKALALRLRREFIDCDDYIEERTKLPIREIFAIGGQSHFRTLESQAISDLSKMDGKVIATGGGAVLRYKNMQALKRNQGIIIHLSVSPEASLRRLQQDPATPSRRPPLTDMDLAAEIRQNIEHRAPYYQRSADIVVTSDEKKVEQIVDEIVRYLRQRGVDGGRENDPVLA